MLTPGAFLPYLDESPLVEELGEWVVGRLCRQLADWGDRGFSPRASFNISARQLRRPGFANLITRTAAEHGVDVSRLAAEITETSTVDLAMVVPALDALREAGLILSLGRTMGMVVIVEGVETAGQLRSLLDCGCRVAQGFRLGRPASPGLIEAALSGGMSTQARQAAQALGLPTDA